MVNTAGEARLAIVPDISEFKKKLEADMRGVKAEFRLDVAANTAQAKADIERFKESQRRDSIKVGVDLGLGEADAKMAAFRARQRANDVNVKVKADTSSALDKVQKFIKETDSAFGALSSVGKVNLQVIGIGAIPAATAAVVDLAGALQQLAQAGLAVPGIMAGAVASIGTLALGVSGIKDAYTAVTKASDDAGKNQTQAANTAARAQRELNNAYNEAKQQIEDLNLAARGDQISQQEAILNAQKARRQLQRDMASGQIKDQLDLQSDLLAIQSADQRVAEVAQKNIENQDKLNKVNAQGVEGNDRVVAAHEAVANAAASSGKATDAAALAMGKLAPNAQEFLKTVIDIKNGGGKDLKQSVQNNMFAGLSTSLRTLSDADLPHLKSGLGSIATAWNGLFKQIASSLGSKSSQGILDRILGNTAESQTRMQKAIDPIIHAVGTLSAAGTDSLPRLADGIGAVAARFDAFISAADKDGRLDKWINDGLTGMRQLGDILLNLGKSFTDITKAAGGGQGFLGILEQGSKKLADFLGSDKGQDKLQNFFRQAHEDLAKWLPILQNLPGIFANVLGAAHDWMDGWLPLLREGAQILRDDPELVKGIFNAFVAWESIKGVASLATSLKNITDLLSITLPDAATKGSTGIAAALGKAGPAMLALLAISGIANDLGPKLANIVGNWTGENSKPISTTDMDSHLAETKAAAAAGNLPGVKIDPDTGNMVPDGTVPPKPTFVAPVPPGAPTGNHRNDPNFTGSAPDHRNDPNFTGSAPAYRPGEAQPGVAGYKPGVGWVDSEGNPTGYNGPPPPGFAKGGPTPNGRGNGPTGGWISELHGDEWVLPAHARKAVGDHTLAALTQGRSFEPGGYVDQWGNPVTPGMGPGPSSPAESATPIAPNPLSGSGGVGNIFGQVLSGLQGPIGNVAGIAQAGIGQAQAGGMPGMAGVQAPSIADRAAQLPGLAGLIGSAGSSNPQAALMNWGSNTAQYVANWGMSTLGKLGSTLWSGALGIFGLQNSILSPSNPYFQSAQKTGQFFLDQNGPLGTLLGMGGNGSSLPYGGDTNSIGSQSITLGDGSTVQIPTYGTSSTPTGATAGGATVGGITPVIGSAQAPVPGAIWYPALGKWMKDGTVVGTTAPGGAGRAGPGAEGWRPAVRAAIATYGPQLGIKNAKAWEDALVRQIQTESGGNPGADNPNDTNGRGGSQHVSGLLQFLPSTFSSNNISGGQYLDPNAQIAAALKYVMSRYGVGGDGSPNQIGRGVGYYSGGPTPSWGGNIDAKGGHLAVVHPNEFVISSRGRSTVPDSFLHALNQGSVKLPGYMDGTPPLGIVQPPPKPNFQVPDAQTMIPPKAVVPAPKQPSAPQAPQAPAQAQPQQVAPQQPQATNQFGPGVAVAPNPTTGTSGMINHNLPALDTLIKSTASTAGTLAATAISMGGAAGGGMGGMGAGALGQMVSGLINEGGKVATQVANVGSSLLVGNVPGSMGAPGARAYGQMARAQQRVPVTAPDANGDTYNFNGMDVNRVFQELDVRKAQQAQGVNAKYGG